MKAAVLLLLSATAAHAQLAASASYTLLHGDPASAGGAVQNMAGTVTADVTSGGAPVGIATGGGVGAKGGFTGQLYDLSSLDVTSTPALVDEGAATQLAANVVMDDNTTLVVSPGDVAWSVVAGPFSGITAGGSATSGNVFEDTLGWLAGSWRGVTDAVPVTVINTGSDDFGTYGSDGLDDDWQVSFFGFDSLDAAPGADPDGDSQDNSLEFLAGVDPDDPTSFFSPRIEPVDGQPGHRHIIFDFLIDRTYVVKSAADLSGMAFVPLVGATVSDAGGERTVTDIDAVGARKFYKVEISRP